jgi:hypothetical protein
MDLDLEIQQAKIRVFDFIDRFIAARLRDEPPPVLRYRRPNRHMSETLGDLLDDIAETFATITKPLSFCGIENDTRIGLRRMGPHVIPKSFFDHTVPIHIDDQSVLSGMMFVAFPGYERTEDSAAASFYYAIKINRVPPGVEPAGQGKVFEFGYCADYVKRTQWDCAYVVVRPTGDIRVCRQQFMVPHHTRQGTYMERRCDVPMHNVTRDGRQLTREERAVEIARDFATLVHAWSRRGDMWSTSVRHAGNRATFCVPPKETKDYFRDRDRTALTPGGRLRPIFHFVREFERRTGVGNITTVREHTRGLRVFTWNGYACAITAPQFHRYTEQSFDLTSVIEDDARPGERVVWASKVGSMLANLEDTQRRA